MKKKMTAILLIAAMILPLGALAEDTIQIDGQIKALKTKTIVAPYTGIVGDYSACVGDEAMENDILFALSATPVYADFDGTITGVFAEPGDSAASVQARYKALCYMERTELYTAQCSTSGADSDNEDKIVHVGELVYIKSSNNSDRKGVARITGVEGKNYTLDVISEKDMRLNEQIKVYRDDGYSSDYCIGSGRLSRIDPVPVTAEGYVRSVYVKEGQQVSRGDLLFEIVPDALPNMEGCDGNVKMPDDGVLLSILVQSGEQIAKDTPMATYCESRDMQLVCAVDEEDLERIALGMEVTVTLDAYRNTTMTGTVAKIASASSEEGSGARFDVTIKLPENDLVRIGMNATAEF